MRIILTGGGTGGHLIPLIAIAESLRSTAQELGIINLELHYFGPKIENDRILNSLLIANIKPHFVIAGKYRRYFSVLNFIDFFKIPLGVLQALFKIFFSMPDVIFSKGGYGSMPIIAAGVFYNVPIIIHESDVVPGIANQKAARFAKQILISFAGAAEFFKQKDKLVFSGNPIRQDLAKGSKEQAQRIFQLKGGRPLILIMGGSQGSQKINDVILDSIHDYLSEFEVIHLTGEKNFKNVRAEANAMLTESEWQYYHPYPYLDDDFKHALAAADVIVSRSGAGALAEIAYFGKPSILIPLAGSASEHQIENAYAYNQNGGAVIIEEINLTPHILINQIKKILTEPGLSGQMAQAAHANFNPISNKLIATTIIQAGLK